MEFGVQLVFLVCSVLSLGQLITSRFVSEDHDDLTSAELETMETILSILEERSKERDEKNNLDTAKRQVKEAFEEAVDRTMAMRREQEERRELGKRHKGHRDLKVSQDAKEKLEEGVTLLNAKISLVKKTGLNLKDIAARSDYKQAWEELFKSPRTRRSTLDSVDCDSVPLVNQYRTMDGTCNNLENPFWGSASTTETRFMPEVYSDGAYLPRLSALDNSDLPSARHISNEVFTISGSRTVSPDEGFNTLMSMNWGQFIDHDLVLTPTYAEESGIEILCCGEDGTPVNSPECLAIEVPADDDDMNIKCMEFVRSFPSPDTTLAGKQVLNALTSFIDGSMVYGSSDEERDHLQGTGGKLRVLTRDGRDLLPEDTSGEAFCTLTGDDPADDYCQEAGDVRVNVQPGLGHMHLLFVRLHNHIVDKLSGVRPNADNDQLFNEARKIVGAIIQHITYKEFFNNLFTNNIIQQYNLGLLDKGYSDDYDVTLDPSITVAFATAALRFGHTMIPDKLAYQNEFLNGTSGITDMKDTLKNPHLLVNKAGSKILGLVRYMTSTSTKRADKEFEGAIRNSLFNTHLDLTSLNVQRGRDNGLPSYTAWRKFCGLKVPDEDDFDLLDDIQLRKRLGRTNMYKSIHDIDLYVGGMLEKRLPGDASYVGPTFSCILGHQFQLLKQGDRFWYERPLPEGFTPDQLQEIRKIKLSTILCDLTEGLTEIQSNVLKSSNKRKSCTSTRIFPRIDFSKWAE